MKYRYLKEEDITNYVEDLMIIYKDNPQITDIQCPLDITSEQDIRDYVENNAVFNEESCVLGIFDDDELCLFGIIIFDSMRLTDDGNAAQLHIAIGKELWGKQIREVCQELLHNTIFTVLYCFIPSKCRPVIGLLKSLNFKKTGYIPKSLPYETVKGEIKMYDELVYSWVKPGEDRDGKVPF